MSWDIFIQNLPSGLGSLDDIPEDYVPAPIGARAKLIEMIKDAVPAADFSDPAWGIISTDDASVEVNIGEDDLVDSVMLIVRGGEGGVAVVEAIVSRLGLPAIDAATGDLFKPGDVARSRLAG
jgi:hypothetical protein